ncbi:SDR family oxidoreductase [Candidatus Aminicenantes bacterium AC-334-K16]|jgi:3-oxoacyl-[acyl-carrier protein] reductase|nr:SDR family oxidoreductase [Candidatus Aminicenantes bacterium AC-334-K16]
MSAVEISLQGQRALITGGSRGIGRATAIYFAQAGCDVAISYQHNEKAAQATIDKLEALGVTALAVKADFSFPETATEMVEQILEKWGRIDILVNNAGIWTYGEMGAMEPSVWEETIKVNLTSIFYTCNAVVPAMKKQRHGNIIIVSSTAGVRGEAFHSHYAATKGALIALTKSLAIELAPYGIRVNCVAPGWVETDMCDEVFQDKQFKEKVRQSIPLGRIPPPEDIAGPILFLASDLARHITGEVLNVNGGSVLCGG